MGILLVKHEKEANNGNMLIDFQLSITKERYIATPNPLSNSTKKMNTKIIEFLIVY